MSAVPIKPSVMYGNHTFRSFADLEEFKEFAASGHSFHGIEMIFNDVRSFEGRAVHQQLHLGFGEHNGMCRSEPYDDFVARAVVWFETGCP